MLEDQRAARDAVVSANEYDNGITGSKVLGRMMVYNPLLESAVLNNYAKVHDPAGKFASALKTKVYNNNTFMTGTSLGDFWGKKFGLKETKDVSASQFSKKWSFNFVKKEGIAGVTGLSDEVAENTVRTGIGFSRNNTSLFNELDKISTTKRIGRTRADGSSIIQRTNSQITNEGIPLSAFRQDASLTDIKKFTDTVNDVSGKNLSSLGTGAVNGSSDVLKPSYVKRGVENMEVPVNLKAFSKNTPMNAIDNFIKTGYIDLKYIDKNASLSDVNTIKDYSAFKNMAGNAFEGGGAKDIMKTTTLSDLFSAGKVDEGFEMMTDAFSKNADTLIQAQTSASKAGIKTVINTADDFISNPALLREGAEELSGLIKNKYFASTVMEKVTGSSFMKFATMVGGEEALFKIAGKVPVSLASIVTVGATTASILSLTHQESMIQSATNLSTFQKVKGEDSLNGKSSQALYANNGRSMSNDQDLDYVLRSSNNAEQYRRDAAPLEIDKTKSNIGNFTLY